MVLSSALPELPSLRIAYSLRVVSHLLALMTIPRKCERKRTKDLYCVRNGIVYSAAFYAMMCSIVAWPTATGLDAAWRAGLPPPARCRVRRAFGDPSTRGVRGRRSHSRPFLRGAPSTWLGMFARFLAVAIKAVSVVTRVRCAP